MNKNIVGLFGLLSILSGCAGQPEGIEVITGFEPERYLGRWYEIARLDHSFERGMDNVTAEYSQRKDGGLKVVNRGRKNGEWKSATGKAFFIQSPDIAQLKVSFFGPFYGGYNVFVLDKENYAYAMVAGNDRDMLWILARSPTLDPGVLESLVTKADALGFDTQSLIYVNQDLASPQ